KASCPMARCTWPLLLPVPMPRRLSLMPDFPSVTTSVAVFFGVASRVTPLKPTESAAAGVLRKSRRFSVLDMSPPDVSSNPARPTVRRQGGGGALPAEDRFQSTVEAFEHRRMDHVVRSEHVARRDRAVS